MSEIETPGANPKSEPPNPLEQPAAAASAATPGADGTVRLGKNRSANRSTLTRSGRLRKWDRPPPPQDWRWYIGNLGKTLIAVGLLMFGFVGYQLYGTGIETAAAQNQLEDDFAEQLALVDAVTAPTFDPGDGSGTVDAPIVGPSETDSEAEVIVPSADEPVAADPFTPAGVNPAPPAIPAAEQNIPLDLENGDALAKIEIPRIGVSDIVVAGVDTGDLKRGPGHFPDTPLPGQLGNAAIAGHRTTYGQPFRNVDQLQINDEIKVTTLSGIFVYRVTGQAIVEPSDYQVVVTTDPTTANLTLTSCHPVFTARQRIVIFSELDRTESAPVGEPVINYGRTEVPDAAVETAPTEIPGDVDLPDGDEPDGADAPVAEGSTAPVAPVADGDTTGSLAGDDIPVAEQLGSDAVNEGIADAFSVGWFSDPGANSQVGLWGLIVGAIAIAAYAISRRFRKDLLGLAIGLVPFTLALYFFFQNVNRLLPPNL